MGFWVHKPSILVIKYVRPNFSYKPIFQNELHAEFAFYALQNGLAQEVHEVHYLIDILS